MAFVAACARAPTRSAHGTACTRRPRSAMTSMRMQGVGAAATRRAFLSACAVALSGTAKFARAEQISTVAAMEVLRDARESLEALAAAAELGEYTSLRVALRTGSLGRIRMAGSALAAADTSREAAYRSLVSAVEQLDVHALRAERGGDRAVVGADVARAVQRVDDFLRDSGAKE